MARAETFAPCLPPLFLDHEFEWRENGHFVTPTFSLNHTYDNFRRAVFFYTWAKLKPKERRKGRLEKSNKRKFGNFLIFSIFLANLYAIARPIILEKRSCTIHSRFMDMNRAIKLLLSPEVSSTNSPETIADVKEKFAFPRVDIRSSIPLRKITLLPFYCR